jgi:hypothetical protein
LSPSRDFSLWTYRCHGGCHGKQNAGAAIK